MPQCRTSTPGPSCRREKLISLQQLRQAQDEQKRTGQNLGATLAKLGYISDGEITNFLSSQYRVPAVNLEEYEIDQEVLKLVSREVCDKHKIIPVSRAGSSLIMAMADPTNLHAIDDIKFLTGFNVEPVVASETAIQAAVEQYYQSGPSYDDVMAGFDEEEIAFGDSDEELNLMELERAERSRRSPRQHDPPQCHQEGRQRHFRQPCFCASTTASTACSSRGDGASAQLKNAMRGRLKIMSQLDMRRRLPQDRRISSSSARAEMDFRVSVLHDLGRESSCVCRQSTARREARLRRGG
jgi:type IV pilus assembly protein PilB